MIRAIRDRRMKGDHIASQIQARTLSTHVAWGEDEPRRTVAAALCDAIREEFGWPNPHYLPDDPLRLVAWRRSADVELLFALHDLEGRLKVDAMPSADFDYDNATLADLVDAIVRRTGSR